MATDGNKGLVILVVVLVVALGVVLFLWQQDQESKDVEIDIGEDASLRPVAEKVVTAAPGLPEPVI